MDKNQIPPTLSFPEDFFFGSATSAFQVEGNVSKERMTDWDDFLHHHPNEIIKPGEVGPNWWTDGVAEKDIQRMKSLGLTMQRLSLEWARIEPKKGQINYRALKRYRQIIDYLKRQHMIPLITLNHFTLPDWSARKGGWENPRTVRDFLDYTQLITEHFPDIHYWIILNEPAISVKLGYLLGFNPPKKQNILSALTARNHLLEAHKKAYTLLKSQLPETKVGSSFSFLWLRPVHPESPIEKLLAHTANYLINTNYITSIQNYMDYVGINFYTGYYVKLSFPQFSFSLRNDATAIPKTLPLTKTVRPKTFLSDMGWPVVPDFFLDLIQTMYKKFRKPIMITENGIADRNDVYRSFFILTHLTAVWKALRDGIPILGYVYWASVDNLEWTDGYDKQFGLIKIDHRTGIRHKRNSAHLYGEIASTQAIHVNQLIKKYLFPEHHEAARHVVEDILTSEAFCPYCNYLDSYHM